MILSGWKEIAQYLHCGVRTVQRWETEGLPVHRPLPHKRSHVIAHSEELDRWVRTGSHVRLDYPKLSASLMTAQRLYEENRARIAELREAVLRLSEGVAQLRARRNRNLVPPQVSRGVQTGELAS